MLNFRYRALDSCGELVSGDIVAGSTADVARKLESHGQILVEAEPIEDPRRGIAGLLRRPREGDVTTFTRDLALLIKSGARINEGLQLLAADPDMGRLRSAVADIRSYVVQGESFAESLSHHPKLFPPVYVALVRVGETSGALDQVLDGLANERARSEALRAKIGDALRYPAFVLVAAASVLLFFLIVVLPQFAAVLTDFNAQIGPTTRVFLATSAVLRNHFDAVAGGLALFLLTGWLLLRRPDIRGAVASAVTRLPIVRAAMQYYRTGLFCRNLGLLLGGGVHLTPTLRILVEIMAKTGSAVVWETVVERVRQGSKLSDALAESDALAPTAIRMLRMGDETGQLPILAGRVAEFYEAKLQRTLDRVVGIVGPAAIIVISVVIGSLIVSVMTALMSVTQMVG